MCSGFARCSGLDMIEWLALKLATMGIALRSRVFTLEKPNPHYLKSKSSNFNFPSARYCINFPSPPHKYTRPPQVILSLWRYYKRNNGTLHPSTTQTRVSFFRFHFTKTHISALCEEQPELHFRKLKRVAEGIFVCADADQQTKFT